MEEQQDDIKGSWCKILYVESGEYNNVRGIMEPDPDEVKRDLIIGYQTTAAGKEALAAHRICTDPECDAVAADGKDHVHTWRSAADYFSADVES